MFFGSPLKIVVKNRDDINTLAARHTPSWLSHAHPLGAASALFRRRRDVRHPSFGGGARLQRASTPPAVERIEHDSSALFALPLSFAIEFDDQ